MGLDAGDVAFIVAGSFFPMGDMAVWFAIQNSGSGLKAGDKSVVW